MDYQNAESRPVDANTTANANTAYKSRWDRTERRIGFTLSKLTGATNISVLNNVERLLASLGTESQPLNGIKVAAASRWCSTVYTNLTIQQTDAIVAACRTDDGLAQLVADPIAYFDGVAGYKHIKPTTKGRQVINTGVFANFAS